jgi:Tol biopolymer transport system component
MARYLIALLVCFVPSALWTASALQVEKAPLLIVSKRTGNAEIFLVNAKGQAARNLTKSKAENSYPAWSPDGTKIVFASDRDGEMNIYVMDADGGNAKQLTKGNQRSRCPAWSPDGKKILFGRTVEDGCGIFVMDADGNNLKQIGDDDGWDPAWSPDGKKILFGSRRTGDGFRIYLMDADGGNVKQLTNNANSFGSVYPSFSPDGKKIMWSDAEGDGLEIYVADADGKNAKKLTQLGGYNTFPIWSADGKSIVFQHLPDYQDGPVYIMDADGGNRRILLKNEALVKGARPAWRPN